MTDIPPPNFNELEKILARLRQTSWIATNFDQLETAGLLLNADHCRTLLDYIAWLEANIRAHDSRMVQEVVQTLQESGVVLTLLESQEEN